MMKKLLCLFTILLFSIGVTNAQNVYGDVGGGSPLLTIATTDVLPPTNTTSTNDGTNFGITSVGNSDLETFTFTSNETGQLIVNVAGITGANFSEFSFSAASPSNITGIGSTSTFNINFNPTSEGVKTAIIEVQVRNFPPPFVTESYFYQITAEAGAGAPMIQLFGDDDMEILNNTFSPSPGDNTHYGDVVANVNSRTRTFTISNEFGTDDLIVNAINGLFLEADFNVVIPATYTLGDPIPAGSKLDIDIVFTPTSEASINEYIEILTNDVDFYFEVLGVGVAPTPDMDVFGNGNLILSGDITPDSNDDTDFGSQDIAAGGKNIIYTIENNGTANLVLTSLAPIVHITGLDAGDFAVTTDPTPTTITPGGTADFIVTFDPTTIGQKDATIEIENSDTTPDRYTFDITGLATEIPPGGVNQLMITQYYEDDDLANNNNWIEVKNISATSTLENAYHLALYEDLKGTIVGGIESLPPNVVVDIPPLTSGEVILFRRSSSASLTNLGSATIDEDTEVCRFTGNDIVLISASNGSNCYNDRIDIMGEVGTSTAINWGTDTSLIKGCGTTEAPTIVYDPGSPGTNINYDPSQYIALTLAEVDNAVANTSIQIGTQTLGTMTWATSWGGTEVPDRTKDVIISGSYSGTSFESCNLTVDGSISLNSGSTNYVLVQEKLTINGSFTIGDTESLITVNPDISISGSIEKEESTTGLNNYRDFTYWSSPVFNQSFGGVFSGVDPNRIFEWNTANFTWDVPTTNMIVAKGYIAEAPFGTTGTHDVTFSGTPNNGTIEIESVFVDDGNPDNDFNLIGNPYPSAIDIHKFIELSDNAEINNGTMNGTIWLWTHNTPIDGSGDFVGNDYASYNLSGGVGTTSGAASPTQNIGSSQGFFVKVIGPPGPGPAPSLGIGDLWFTNDMRLKNENNQFFRAPVDKNKVTEDKDRIWLNVESNTGGAFNQLLVGFFDQATDGVDRGYDGDKVSASWINFYSKIDDARYGIQGLPSFTVDKKVTLGFDTYIDQLMTYKMSIDNIEGVLNDNDVYIVDNELGITHDLKLADYEFEIDGSDSFPDRFTLQFTSAVLDIDDLELNNDFIITNEENALQLRSSTVITDLKVYDMMGRLLIDSKPNDSNFSINTNTIKKGTVLILNVTFDNGAEVSKKAIRY